MQQVIEAARDAVASGEPPAEGRVVAEALFEFSWNWLSATPGTVIDKRYNRLALTWAS